MKNKISASGVRKRASHGFGTSRQKTVDQKWSVNHQIFLTVKNFLVFYEM